MAILEAPLAFPPDGLEKAKATKYESNIFIHVTGIMACHFNKVFIIYNCV